MEEDFDIRKHLRSINIIKKGTLKKESRVWLNEKQKEIVTLYGFNNICKWFFDEALTNYSNRQKRK